MNAAFTFLHANPGHEDMQHNIAFFLKEKGSAQSDMINSEAKEYQELFVKGVEAFDKKAAQKVMDFMEGALEAYLNAEEDCRAMCEGTPRKTPFRK